ncbi:solute carrier family 2, facilitated glucose transporter member 5-like [Clavelina lepadiformis]|uniref:solute carrier family 2, facilitated glucose transporter member 5-like n=1 Tax=Clavelina lepadiformis TaxID=159417 RepID=UPI0040416E49
MSEYRHKGITFTLVVSVLAAALSTFQAGYNMAVVSLTPNAQIIQGQFLNHTTNCTRADGHQITTNPEKGIFSVLGSNTTQSFNQTCVYDHCKVTFLWLLTVSIYPIGGMIGSTLIGFCIRKLGRRGTLISMNPFSIVGAIMIYKSTTLTTIIVARLIQGIFAGLATGVVSLYIGEISPKEIRGAMITVSQLSVALGLLTAQIFGFWQDYLCTSVGWRSLLAFTVFPSALQLLVLPLVPDSPRALYINHGWRNGAERALKKFRGTNEIEKELEEMGREMESERENSQLLTNSQLYESQDNTTDVNQEISERELRRKLELRKHLKIVALTEILQQLCGIYAILFFVKTLVPENGNLDDFIEQRRKTGVIVCSVNVFTSSLSIFLIETVGRRRLLLVGYGFAGICCIPLGVAILVRYEPLGLASMIGYIVGFAIGPGPATWAIPVEFFRQSTRSAASTIGHLLNWTAMTFIFWVFSGIEIGFEQTELRIALGTAVFFFMIICFMACAFVQDVPETKNKSFREIHEHHEPEEVPETQLSRDEDRQQLIQPSHDGELSDTEQQDEHHTQPKGVYDPKLATRGPQEDISEPMEIDLRQASLCSAVEHNPKGIQPTASSFDEASCSNQNSASSSRSRQGLSLTDSSLGTSMFRDGIDNF